MKLTQFEIKKPSGLIVKGEYEGNEKSRKVILFSHGFGVTRDSHGMFNEIGDELKDNYLVVRFDYTIVNKEENWSKVFPYSKQKEMLTEVYKLVMDTFNPNEVSIIAHSMGCLITGLAQLENINKILLLAFPPQAPYESVKEYFLKRPETVINESATSVIKRSDGSITYVESDFWNEMKTINPPDIYKKLINNSEVKFVKASLDQIITAEEYKSASELSEIKCDEINGNHDFEGKARKELIRYIKSCFS